MPQYETGGMDIVVAGTADAVMMVEGGGNEIIRGRVPGRGRVRARGDLEGSSPRSTSSRRRPARPSAKYPALEARTPRWRRWVENSRKTSPRRCALFEKRRAQRRVREAHAQPRRSCGSATRSRELAALSRGSRSGPDFDKIIKAMEEEELRVMVVDEKIRPDGGRTGEIRPIWSKVPLRAARARQRRLHPRSDAGVHGRDARLHRATNSASTGSWRSPTSATCTTKLPAVLDRRDAADARPRGAARSVSARLAERALVPMLPSEGRVSLHAAPHQRSARVERFVVDGVGVRTRSR